MAYQTPEARHAAVAEVLEALDGVKGAILTTHVHADGDAIGSEVALAAWLRAQGVAAHIVNPTPVPQGLRFVVPDASWVVDPSASRARELRARADVAVVLDAGEVPRIGRVMSLIEGLDTIVVDHHPPGDEPIAGVSFRDPSACATGELVFDILRAGCGPWPAEADLALYVAILTDTGSFRFSNSSPASHHIVAELLDRGVSPDDTYRRVYGTFPLRRLRLLREALGELRVDPGRRVAWMTVRPEVHEELGATADDLAGLVDYPRSVEGVEVGLLFRKTARGGIKISFRSNGQVDVNELARRLGGGGHVRAAGALVEGALDQVRADVVATTLEAVERMRSEG